MTNEGAIILEAKPLDCSTTVN